MKASFSSLLLLLCAAVLSASSAWANITAPGAIGAPMAPPPVTVNLGGSPEAATSNTGTGPISVIQAFPNEQATLRSMDGASMFWLGMLGLLGVTLFATGTVLIAQSTKIAVQETVKTAKTRMAPVTAVRKAATV